MAHSQRFRPFRIRTTHQLNKRVFTHVLSGLQTRRSQNIECQTLKLCLQRSSGCFVRIYDDEAHSELKHRCHIDGTRTLLLSLAICNWPISTTSSCTPLFKVLFDCLLVKLELFVEERILFDLTVINQELSALEVCITNEQVFVSRNQ